jgi:hypothetical protein
MKSQAAAAVSAQLNEVLAQSQRLGNAVDTTLDITQQILALGVDASDVQLLKVVKGHGTLNYRDAGAF